MRGAPSLLFMWLVFTSSVWAQTCGDCNGDGSTDILDALVAAQHAAGLILLVSPSFELCNVDGTPGGPPPGTVDILDALLLAQFAAGLVPALSCPLQPSCTVTTPAPPVPAGDVLVDYRAIDALGAPVDLSVEFSTDAGSTWSPAIEGAGGDGVLGLSTSPAPGDAHVYSWDSVADGIGGVTPQAAILRLSLTGATGGSDCETAAFMVDNSGQWTLLTAAAQWHARRDHTSVVFDDKIWVIGGFWHLGLGNNHYLNDVWWSSDGVTWTEATPAAAWEPRYDHASAVYAGKMWVIGGSYDSGGGLAYPRNDVWHSTDGVTWTEATAAAPFGERGAMGCVVFDGKLWVIAGAHQFSAYRDAWWTMDGASWTAATLTAPWTPVVGHGCLVHDAKIWLGPGIALAGITNDLWTSLDGAAWTRVAASTPWGPRYDYSTVSHGGLLWILAGHLDGMTGEQSDVWSSPDGLMWTQETAAAPWSTRRDHTSVVFHNRIWVLGGYEGATYRGDVWAMP